MRRYIAAASLFATLLGLIAENSQISSKYRSIVLSSISLFADDQTHSKCGLYDLLSVRKSDRSAFPPDEKDALTGEVHYEIWTAKVCDQSRSYGVEILERNVKVVVL